MIDAAENNWPAYEITEHYRLAKYYTVDEHSRVPEIQLASLRTWNKLPEAYREIITECALESAQYQRALWQEQESMYRADALEAGCVEIILTSEERDAFQRMMEPLYEQYCSEYMELVDQIQNG